jgi:hypothetical protein
MVVGKGAILSNLKSSIPPQSERLLLAVAKPHWRQFARFPQTAQPIFPVEQAVLILCRSCTCLSDDITWLLMDAQRFPPPSVPRSFAHLYNPVNLVISLRLTMVFCYRLLPGDPSQFFRSTHFLVMSSWQAAQHQAWRLPLSQTLS